MLLLTTVIKNLAEVVMQRYNYPKLIQMKQNITDLIDNFCIHLCELSRIEPRRKRGAHWTALQCNGGQWLDNNKKDHTQ